jgi:glycerol-3-phosphate acyltransferase PlsY
LPELVWVWAAVALAAVLGHVFTPWLGFRGGKGIATGSGAVLALFPIMTIAGVIGAVVWFVSSRLTRMVSAASIIAAASLPVGVVIAHQISVSIGDGRGPITPFVVLGFVLAFLVVYTHRANIGRIRRGQEPRIGSGKASVGPSGGVDLPR